MNQPKTFVLDSWAIMAFFEDEPSAERIADLIADAHDKGHRLLMSVVNAGEVWYTTSRKYTNLDADKAIRRLRSILVEFIEVDWHLARIAAAYKSKGGISYADCFAAALAKHNKATLVTGDKEFEQLNDDISILWL